MGVYLFCTRSDHVRKWLYVTFPSFFAGFYRDQEKSACSDNSYALFWLACRFDNREASYLCRRLPGRYELKEWETNQCISDNTCQIGQKTENEAVYLESELVSAQGTACR